MALQFTIVTPKACTNRPKERREVFGPTLEHPYYGT